MVLGANLTAFIAERNHLKVIEADGQLPFVANELLDAIGWEGDELERRSSLRGQLQLRALSCTGGGE